MSIQHVLSFNFIILGNMAKGVPAIPDWNLDQQPPILEITTNAKTAEWKQLGVQLELNADLAGCHDYTEMYQLWIMKKAENTTQRKLISALRAIQQNNIEATSTIPAKTTGTIKAMWLLAHSPQ